MVVKMPLTAGCMTEAEVALRRFMENHSIQTAQMTETRRRRYTLEDGGLEQCGSRARPSYMVEFTPYGGVLTIGLLGEVITRTMHEYGYSQMQVVYNEPASGPTNKPLPDGRYSILSTETKKGTTPFSIGKASTGYYAYRQYEDERVGIAGPYGQPADAALALCGYMHEHAGEW